MSAGVTDSSTVRRAEGARQGGGRAPRPPSIVAAIEPTIAATGVTDGALVRGPWDAGGATLTESILMTGEAGGRRSRPSARPGQGDST